jgi:DNA-binding response OmpR family regulator
MKSSAQRVLIVDDDIMVADTLNMVFQKNGFDVRSRYSANEGLTCAREFRPDLLLCDIVMPGRDGISLAGDISRELPDCRILVLTGFYADLDEVHGRSRHLRRPLSILTKPCFPGDLIREANAMLSVS